MGQWLRSGLRRDVCVVLYDLGEPTGQQCKAALEDHYDERVSPGSFYGALDTLVETGHVAERADGIHDRYELTEAGERALLAHHEWACERLDL
ncbi:multidrug DMT transporter permease [Halobacteriales archaeon QS_8_69_26]|nr:MAG: multidrug DMT transporter permease [Halobacteriales archaeon QS_8_69_26]